MGIDHVDRMFARKPKAVELSTPEPGTPPLRAISIPINATSSFITCPTEYDKSWIEVDGCAVTRNQALATNLYAPTEPAAKIPSPSDPSSWTAEQLAEYQADDGSPWHHGRYLYFANPTPAPLCSPNPCVSPNMEAMQKVVEWVQKNFRSLGAMKTYVSCSTCWGLGFIPGASGRHITCEDCGYEEVPL